MTGARRRPDGQHVGFASVAAQAIVATGRVIMKVRSRDEAGSMPMRGRITRRGGAQCSWGQGSRSLRAAGPPQRESFTAKVDALMRAYQGDVPGASVLVLKDGQTASFAAPTGLA